MLKFYNRLLTSCILTLSLAIINAALAEYKQPPDQRAPRSSTSTTGSRGGCSGTRELPLTTLAPQKHVGQTVSNYPTFAWFVPDSQSFPMEFALYEYGSDGNIKSVQKIPLTSSQGIMKLSLPKDKLGLTVGKRYLWQVAVLCKPNYPSSDLVATAEIEVVQMPPDLKQTLDATESPLKRADIYAKAGLWYDALGEALESTENSRLGEIASNLLEDLAKLEQPERSANLRLIASSKRQ